VTTSVLVAGARTPVGKFLGSLRELSVTDLGALAIEAAVQRAGIDAHDVDAVHMGTVVQAGTGPNPARIAAARAGIPMSVPATTINKLCLSGLTAIALADQAIRLGQADIVVAGGMESMTGAPHLHQGMRRGVKFGATPLDDALEVDALHCAFDEELVGAATDRYMAPLGISRQEHDEFAVRSHRRAAGAADRLSAEIIPVRTRSGVISRDEGVRSDITAGDLARLRPAFDPAGVITAGSSSPLSDGAAAVVVMRRELAEERGLPWLAEIGGYGTVAGPDASLLAQPANAILDALKRDGSELDQLDLVEINEAFAGVVLHSTQLLGVPLDRVNVNGGAIAVGHPVGMSGARLVLTLALELSRRGGGTGAAALCGGGGQGDALILRVPRTGD
jgi:acetyl-CoA C-acetyltransferase